MLTSFEEKCNSDALLVDGQLVTFVLPFGTYPVLFFLLLLSLSKECVRIDLLFPLFLHKFSPSCASFLLCSCVLLAYLFAVMVAVAIRHSVVSFYLRLVQSPISTKEQKVRLVRGVC
jgi:hypothetical protein